MKKIEINLKAQKENEASSMKPMLEAMSMKKKRSLRR
jgi:hypothetical protein